MGGGVAVAVGVVLLVFRGKILGYVRRRTTTKPFTKDVVIDHSVLVCLYVCLSLSLLLRLLSLCLVSLSCVEFVSLSVCFLLCVLLCVPLSVFFLFFCFLVSVLVAVCRVLRLLCLVACGLCVFFVRCCSFDVCLASGCDLVLGCLCRES